MFSENPYRLKTCCFSGYRPHKFKFEFSEKNKRYRQLETDIFNTILQAYKNGYEIFLCGGAMGFDILCGEMVLKIKKSFPQIKLICILPFQKQEFSFSKEWQKRYRNLTDNADEIIYVSEKYNPGCYQERNIKMINLSSMVITYFDGQKGGTSNTIAYAQLNKLTVINLSKSKTLPKQLTFFTS